MPRHCEGGASKQTYRIVERLTFLGLLLMVFACNDENEST